MGRPPGPFPRAATHSEPITPCPEGDLSAPDRQVVLDEDARQAVFAALVALQDDGIPVGHSRTVIVERFGFGGDVVRAIEQEGLSHEWPPL